MIGMFREFIVLRTSCIRHPTSRRVKLNYCFLFHSFLSLILIHRSYHSFLSLIHRSYHSFLMMTTKIPSPILRRLPTFHHHCLTYFPCSCFPYQTLNC